MNRWRAVTTAALLTGTGLAAAPAAPAPSPAVVRTATTGYAPGPVVVTAEPVTGMYPGATRHLRLRVTGPGRRPVVLAALHATVTGTSRPGCRPVAANLTVGRYPGSLPRVVGAGTPLAALPVHMPVGAAGACTATVFRIRVTAVVRGAR